MKDDKMQNGPHDNSREILVKTPGNNSSLRLNAKSRTHGEQTVWEVTLPIQAPLKLIKENGRWLSVDESQTDSALIEAIGYAIDKQLTI